MSKKKKNTGKAKDIKRNAGMNNISKNEKYTFFKWGLILCVITAVCLFPILRNELTNWDDEYYINNNPLLRGPDWAGIFSEPVVGNYHPLTILTYAFNYAISGLDPFSYLLVNYLLHILNTILVFRFIWHITNKNSYIAFFVALIFGIHPMHVESVAWVSERKDVLYTLFFLLALIEYWKYIGEKKLSKYFITFLFFSLSLLSKPAAIILPLVLLLLDYWKGRPFTTKSILEKIPFLVLSAVFGILTIKIQSPTAMASLDVFTFTDRILFACYVLMIYFFRFFIPYPLSAFHPFPASNNLGLLVMLSPLFILALTAVMWYFRKNKIIIFGFLFYIINLLLVLQVVSIGLTIVSERYTYMPYIGLAFILGSIIFNTKFISQQTAFGLTAILGLIFGFMTFQRTKVWKNSNTLWTDVIKTYPATPYPRTNRANYISKEAEYSKDKRIRDSLFRMAIDDCDIALSVKPNLPAGYEKRSLAFLGLGMENEALADADSLVKFAPGNKIGYDVRGTIYYRRKQPAKAMEAYDKCIEINPTDHRSYSNRGIIYMNYYNQYPEALVELNKAIEINPLGNYFLNRSICYYRMGNLDKAREDARVAISKGTILENSYKLLLQLK